MSQFRHDAFFNERLHRVEMHLVSLCDQDISVGGQTFHFANQETIHTENSYKYTVDRFTDLAMSAGFRTRSEFFRTQETIQGLLQQEF